MTRSPVSMARPAIRPAFGFLAPAVTLLCWMGANAIALAQPVPSRAPTSTHIFPAGGPPGKTTTVRVGAECLPPGADFAVFGAGLGGDAKLLRRLPHRGEPSPRRAPTEVPITYPKEWEAAIRIAADAPLGVGYWRISCAQGGSGCRPFIVSDLPNVLEHESNSTPESANQISPPCAVNGQLCGERDVDYFAVELSAGEAITCELFARRLGSAIDPVVEVVGVAGANVDLQTHAIGEDLSFGWVAPTSGEYLIRIANVSFHGNPSFVYRLHATKQPLVRFVFPPAAAVGETAEVTVHDLFGKQTRRQIQLAERRGANRYALDEFNGGLEMVGHDRPVLIEHEPNDQPPQATEIGPGVVYGQATLRDRDWFTLTVEKGRAVHLVCRGYPRNQGALPVLRLWHDEQLVKTARSVDHADRTCRISWTPPRDGVARLEVSDVRAAVQGDPSLIYELDVRRDRPDFALHVETDVINGGQGAKSVIDVRATRWGGFDGPITVSAAKLPQDVEAPAVTIPAGKNSAKLALQVGDKVASQSTQFQIVGEAKLDEQQITRSASFHHLGRDSEGVAADHVAHERIFLTVAHKPVFRLFCSEAYLYAHRGSIFPYPMTVERLEGFTGEIRMQIGDRQNRDLDGIEMVPTIITRDQTDFHLPIYLPETMHINIQSQSQLYSQAHATFTDEHGREQVVLVVSEKRNMLRTLPPVAKLRAVDERVCVAAGSAATCRVALKRTSNFTGTLELKLTDAAIADGFELEPSTIVAGATSGAAVIRTPPNWNAKSARLTLRGTGPLPGGSVFVSECQVELRRTP